MIRRSCFGPLVVRPLAAVAAVALAVLSSRHAAAKETGLRWVGDARAATTSQGALLFGPALRFRYGMRLGSRRAPDGWADRIGGSFFGTELSAGLLFGRPEPGRVGAVTLLALRPWLSRSQPDWFLGTERWSVLGALLPETGVTFGIRRVPRLHLGWDLPLGPHAFQFVPGVVWFSPGKGLPLLFTLAFRVPM